MFTPLFIFTLVDRYLRKIPRSFPNLDVYYSGLRRYNKTEKSYLNMKGSLEGTYCLTSQTLCSSQIIKSSPGSEVIFLIFYLCSL